MKTRPQVTEEEIKTFMDFDALLLQTDKFVSKHRKIRRTRNLFIGFMSLLAIPSLIFFLGETKEQGPRLKVTISPSQPQPSPVSKDTMPSQELREEKQSPPVMRQQEEEPTPDKPKIVREKASLPDKEQGPPRQPIYVQAEPVDGYPALYDYFDKNLIYPPAARKDGIEGVVEVAFVIDTTGKAIKITVENSLGEVFDKEVIRLMEKMPAWRPASYNGKPVQNKISLPITFSIAKSANP